MEGCCRVTVSPEKPGKQTNQGNGRIHYNYWTSTVDGYNLYQQSIGISQGVVPQSYRRAPHWTTCRTPTILFEGEGWRKRLRCLKISMPKNFLRRVRLGAKKKLLVSKNQQFSTIHYPLVNIWSESSSFNKQPNELPPPHPTPEPQKEYPPHKQKQSRKQKKRIN
jgi:hypothetical protein